MIIVESYRKEVDTSDTSTELAVVETFRDYSEEEEKLAQELNMTMAKDIAGLGSQERLELASRYYEELQGKSLETWETFLPTSYTLRNYSFDAPPMDALKSIQAAKSLHIFDSIEIWTEEGNSYSFQRKVKVEAYKDTFQDKKTAVQNSIESFVANFDPMAVGIIYDRHKNAHFFPIVRWGEALRSERSARVHNFIVKAQMAATFKALPVTLLAIIAFATTYSVINYKGWTILWAAIVLAVIGLTMLGVSFARAAAKKMQLNQENTRKKIQQRREETLRIASDSTHKEQSLADLMAEHEERMREVQRNRRNW